MAKSANVINHISFLLDATTSMEHLQDQVVKITDTQIRQTADQSRFHDQETRVTVYTFNYDGMAANVPCLIYDKDVLRMPSIAGLYKPHGWTPLCEAIAKVVSDMELIPELYGDHSHLLYVVTDGFENHSKPQFVRDMPNLLRRLDEKRNWTVAVFTPDIISKNHLITKLGFHRDNIMIWDPSKENMDEVAVAMAATTDAYMGMRASGQSATSNLFSMAAPKLSDVQKTMAPMTPGAYYFQDVTQEKLAALDANRIDKFFEMETGSAYSPGRVYYQMIRRERIQAHKKIAIADKLGNVYAGDEARTLLGLPPYAIMGGEEVRRSPGRWRDYSVFIQSGSMNRKLYPGTRMLVMR